MYTLQYTLTTLAPVLITSSAGELNTVNTEQYIPGSSVLGSVAHQYIKHRCANILPHEDPTFRKWFLNEGLKFTNAYVMSDDTYFPAPHSMQKLKYKKSVYDFLFQERDGDKQTAKIDADFIRIKNTNIETCDVKTSLNFHHARERETGTPEEERFFNYESINPGQSFRGNILGEEPVLQELAEFLTQEVFQEDAVLYIGRSKNAQYGELKIEIAKTPALFFSEIDQQNHDKIDIDEEGISMTLLSDLILYNDYGFPTTELSVLQEKLQIAIDRSKSFIKAGFVENFYSAWGLPRPADICFKAGSTFLIKAVENDKERLLQIQQDGFGERRYEGFGRVVFGWQQDEDHFTKIEFEPADPLPPQSPIPALTQTTIKKIINEALTKQVQLQALKDANNFTRVRPPSKSLISRLEAIIRQKENEPKLREYLLKVLNDPPKTSETALRRTAKDQLKRCRNNKQTLFEFLNSFDVNIEELLQQHSDIKKLADETGLLIAEDKTLSNTLYRLYLITFFAAMRKNLTIQKGGQ